jgi:muramoyltetrapeptide carboxypeptidase
VKIFGRDKREPDGDPLASIAGSDPGSGSAGDPMKVTKSYRVPPPIEEGSAVAVVSPSWGGAGRWPHRVERATKYLESLGLWVKMMPNADRQDGWTSAPAAERADDLHRAFDDDDVSVVLASIGGNHSNQLLPYLDWGLIRSNPKWLQGYSDITVLNWALLKHAGLASMHGPAFTLEMAEYPEVFAYTDRWLRAAWFREQPLRFEAARVWTEEFLDFDKQDDLSRARRLQPSEGWVTIRDGAATGPLIGGCLETICWHLKGSSEWLDLDGSIFFFETSEEVPPPEHIDAYLTDLENLGVFEAISGLIVGRPRGYTDDDRKALWDIVAERTDAAAIPVLGNLDIGHTDPMLTLPIGVDAELDATSRTLQSFL